MKTQEKLQFVMLAMAIVSLLPAAADPKAPIERPLVFEDRPVELGRRIPWAAADDPGAY